MLQENYTVIIPIVFAIIAMLINLLSRRDGDTSPIRNDTCIGQAMMLGALSASLVFAVNAQKALRDLNESISEKEPLVREAEARISAGTPLNTDLANIRLAREEIGQAAKRASTATLCIVAAVVCIMLVLAFALVDRFYAFEMIKDASERETLRRKWNWWVTINVVGLAGFVTVLLFTKPGK